MTKIWKPGDFIDTPDCQRWENGLGGGAGGFVSAQVLNLGSFILPADADATPAFNRVIAAALALNKPVEIVVPPGSYNISSTIAATLTGAQAILLRGAGSGISVIRQTADASGIVAVLQNYGGFGLGGAFNVRGLSIVMAAATSTTRTALSVTTSAASGATGVPLVLDDLVISSPGAPAAYWGTAIGINEFADFSYISRISIYSSGGVGTGIALTGNSTSYTTGSYLGDISIAGTNIGLLLGEFLQGIAVDNLNTVNTLTAVQSFPTLPAADSAFVFTRCYLMGRTLFHALEGATAQFQIRMASCYFDGNVNGAAPPIVRHVQFINVPQVTITGCTFNGAQPPASTPITGLYFQNQSYDTIVSNCTFGGYGAPGDGSASVALLCDTATTNISVLGCVFDYNARSASSLGAGNVFAGNAIRRCEAGSDGFYLHGTAACPAPAPGIIAGPGIAITSPNSGIEIGSTVAANTPFLDFHSSGGPRDYDSRIIASAGSTTVNGQGVLDYLASLHRFGGNILATGLPASASYANDAAAAVGGVAVGQLYRTGNAVMVRLV